MISPSLVPSGRHPVLKLWIQDPGAVVRLQSQRLNLSPCCTPGRHQMMIRVGRGGERGGSTGSRHCLGEGTAQGYPDWPGREGCLVQPQFCSHRKNYEALCQMYEKIQPLLENLHRNFIETRNNIGEPRRVGCAGQRGGLEVIPAPPQSHLCAGSWELP